MGYYISTMIGIRTGGVFSDDVDMDDLKMRVEQIRARINDVEGCARIPRLNVSDELNAAKGRYVVIAGVFNYWHYEDSSMFAAALSQEFCAEVMIMSWDEQTNVVQAEVFMDGKPLHEANENPFSKAIRRCT